MMLFGFFLPSASREKVGRFDCFIASLSSDVSNKLHCLSSVCLRVYFGRKGCSVSQDNPGQLNAVLFAQARCSVVTEPIGVPSVFSSPCADLLALLRRESGSPCHESLTCTRTQELRQRERAVHSVKDGSAVGVRCVAVARGFVRPISAAADL